MFLRIVMILMVKVNMNVTWKMLKNMETVVTPLKDIAIRGQLLSKSDNDHFSMKMVVMMMMVIVRIRLCQRQ